MLSVDIDQHLCQFFHLSGCHGLPVDLKGALGRLQLPADDHCAVLLGFQFQFCQLLQHFRPMAYEDQFHQATLCPFAQHLLVKPASQGQIHTADQQGFARAGLTSEDIQPLPELHLCLFHQRQILHM